MKLTEGPIILCTRNDDLRAVLAQLACQRPSVTEYLRVHVQATSSCDRSEPSMLLSATNFRRDA